MRAALHPTVFPSSRWLTVWPLVALLTGGLVAIHLWPLALIMLFSLTLALLFLVVRDKPARGDGFFWLMIALLLLTPLVGRQLGRNLGFVLEVVLMAALPLMLWSLAGYVRSSAFVKLVALITAGFVVIALASSVLGRSTVRAGVYQLLSDMKFFAMLGFGLVVAMTPRSEDNFWRLVTWLWLPLFALVFWQWTAPSTYATIWSGYDGSTGPNPFIPGLSRACGGFTHPSVLASLASLFFLFSVIRLIFDRQRRFVIPGLAYCFLLISSGQRQELAAALVTALAVFGFLNRRRPVATVALSIAAGLAAAALVVALWFGGNIMEEASGWGITGGAAMTKARAVLYADSFDIAGAYWPLGSGLGTFASAGSVKFDPSFYYEKGYTAFWWFMKKDFLLDAFWPKYIAETGWLGAVLVFSVLPVLLAAVLRKIKNCGDSEQRRLWLMSFGGLFFAFATSPTAFTLTDPNVGFMAFVFLGVAYRKHMDVDSREASR